MNLKGVTRVITVERPVTPEDKEKVTRLMEKTRGTSLYETLEGREVYHLPWHPMTQWRVMKMGEGS